MFGCFKKKQPVDLAPGIPDSVVAVRQNKSPYRTETSTCVGYGTQGFTVTNPKTGNVSDHYIAVFFFQNGDGSRFYELEGERGILQEWAEDKNFQCALQCELWVRTGIKPDWYTDAVMEKLKRGQ